MAILSWSDYKNYFDYDQQATVDEVNNLYITYKNYLYVTQLFSQAPEEISTFLNGFSTSSTLYTEFAKFIHGRTAWVGSWQEERKWQDYSTSFPEEMQNAIFQMTLNIRKTHDWSTFVSNGYTEVINYFDSYYEHKKAIVYGFSKYMIRKANEMSGVWVNTERQYKNEEQIRIVEFNYFLYNQVYFKPYYSNTDLRHKIITSMSALELADFLALYIHYYFPDNQRKFLNYLVQELSGHIASVLNKKPASGSESQAIASAYPTARQAGVQAFIEHLISRGIVNNGGIKDLLKIPQSSGVSDALNYTSDNLTGIELQYNGDFSESMGGWFNSSYQLVTDLKGDSGLNRNLYTGGFGMNGKIYRVQVQVLDISSGNTIVNSGITVFTASAPGIYTFDYLSLSPNLYFNISRFSNVSIREVFPFKDIEAVSVIQTPDLSNPQISHVYINDSYYILYPGISYMLLLNQESTVSYTSVTGTASDLISGLTAAINAASGEVWGNVTATDGGSYIIVTGNANNVLFSLEVVSLKKELLSLATNHPFYVGYAQQFLDYIKTNADSEYLDFVFPGRVAGVDGRVGGFTVEATNYSIYPFQYLGTETTQANGYFEIRYKLTKPYQQITTIQIVLKENDTVLTTSYFSVQNGSKEVKTIVYNDYPATPAYTTIADVVTATGLSIPSALSTFLSTYGITTLKDIRVFGGLRYATGLPVSQDDPAVIALDAHADLNTISYDILVNQKLIDSGILSLQDLNNMNRSDAVNRFMALSGVQAGGFNALKIHTVSQIYGSFLQSLITGHRSANNTPSPMGKIPQLNAVLEEQCICNDCDAAVSPLAYLTDLLNYTVSNIKYNGAGNTFAFLESKFFQNFKELPHYCDAEENLVCQQRVVVEILRRYISDSAHIPTSGQITALNKATKEYVVNSYRFLLQEFGTSYEELRDVRVGNDSSEQKSKLAKRLNIPYVATGPDAYDPFATLFIDLKSIFLTEAYLEKVFGLIDTTRNYLCTGLKLEDPANQLQRWTLYGFSWNKNISAEGFIYLDIDNLANHVRVYKNSSLDVSALVAVANQVDTNRYLLEPYNESGLSGEFILADTSNNSAISISLVPMTTSWRLQNQRNLWKTADIAANPYYAHTIPIIEPDIIGPNDFRNTVIDNPEISNHPFEVWINRRLWIDEQLTNLQAQGIYIQNILSVMNVPVDYTKLDTTTVSHASFTTVPSYATLLELYQHITDASSTDYESAAEQIKSTMNLSVGSFIRLFEIYQASVTNDTKGVQIVIAIKADTGIEQQTNITYSGVKKGDIFYLVITDSIVSPDPANVVTYTAIDGDTEVTVAEKLRHEISIAGGDWTQVTVLNSIPVIDQPLKIKAIAANTPFTISSKILRTATSNELEEVYSILTQSRKNVFYPDWIDEEQSLQINLNSADYWKSLTEPVAGTWPILQSLTVPLIDPENVYVTDLAEPSIGNDAIEIWQTRLDVLTDIYNTIESTRESVNLDAAFKYAWGDTYLPYTYTRVLPSNDIVFNTLDDVLTGLNNLNDPEAITVAENYISTFLYTNSDAFRTLMSVRAKNELGNPEAVSKEDWATMYAILTSARKIRTLYTSWATEEATYSYWQISKAQLPKWRADASARSLWQTSLQLTLRSPIIDPDVIRPDFIKSLDIGTPAITLWNNRYTNLDLLFNQIKDERETVGLSAVQGFDLIIETYLGPSIDSAGLIHLSEEGLAGEIISNKLAQLNIDQEILEFLLNIRSLAQTAPGAILEDEWNEVYSILVQVDKARTYSTWREEEITAGIFLTPDYFIISDYSRQNFFDENQQHIINRRRPENALRDWINNLQARIDQEKVIYDGEKKRNAASEEEYIKDLRDALILATDADGTKLEDKAKVISDRLLVDAENNCCQKVTRISQAIETLQGLFFSIRNGLIQDTYPGLNIRIASDRFDEEWMWMGSYGNWRSAMFVTLYPENLLYPTYRAQQSYGFRSFAGYIRDNTRLTPDSVCTAVHDYFTYYEDICTLSLVASCSGKSISYKGYGCGSAQLSAYKNLQHLFATGTKTGNLYWSTIDTDSSDDYAHSFWSPISAFKNVSIERFLGATPWAQSDNKNAVLLFAEILKEGESMIAYARLNLDTNNWEDDITELAIPSIATTFEAPVKKIILNKSNELVKVPNILFAIHRGEKVLLFQLNKKGSDFIDADGGNAYANQTITDTLDLIRGILIYKSSVTGLNPIPKSGSHFYIPPKYKNGKFTAYESYSTTILEPYTFHKLNAGTRQITDTSFSTYQSAFIWPDGDNNLNNDKFYIIYDTTNNEIRYSIFDDNSQFVPAGNVFISGLEQTYVFANSSGKTFILYQQAKNKDGIYISDISRDSNTQKITLVKNTEMRLTPNTAGPFSIHPGNPDTMANYKVGIQTTYRGNMDLKRSGSDYIAEAYYFVPMLAALSLQNKGYYTQALDWFRLVYDYSVPVSAGNNNHAPRKIWYGLIAEEAYVNDFKRIQNWLNDPINPHAIAESRQNSYTRYTVISIVRCMMDFANNEFSKDDAESVPKARLLYEEALELLNEEQLVSEEANCQLVINNLLDYEPADANWYDWKPVWLGIITDLYKISDKNILNNAVALIEAKLAGPDSLSDKMAYSRDVTDDAQETPELFSDISTLIATDRVTTREAMMRILQNGNIGNLAEKSAYELAESYLRCVSLVTALPTETLSRTDFFLNWFADEPQNVTNIPSPNNYSSVIGNYPVRNGMQDRGVYNYVTPTNEQILTLNIIRNPIKAVNDYFGKTALYLPKPNLAFCVPPNPVLNGIVLEAEVNLYKLRNCMNIAGVVRELSPYAAPTDQFSGIPVATAGGQISTGNFGGTFRPSPYRFDVLIQRAKEQVQLAQQIESSLLSMYEKADAENYSLLRAKQDMKVSQSNIKLQDLRLKAAYSGITLAELQKDRVTISSDYYKELLQGNGMSELEQAALNMLIVSNAGYLAASLASIFSSTFDAGASPGYIAQAIGVTAQILNQMASYERRRQEWEYQQELTTADLKISDQQIKIATDQKNVVDQERQIAVLQNNNAQATLDFLANKFTNAELYEWMSKVLSNVYSFLLQQATSTALTASNQLRFERQQEIPSIIKNDYWEAPSDAIVSLSGGSGNGPDRRGLTASARLLQDVIQLDQLAFDTDKRRLELTKNISLASLDPVAFQQFRETGSITFQTPMELFDRDFPGHYLRLIKRVRVSVIALIPPIDGIKATLINPGISYTVVDNTFQRVPVRRDPEIIALTVAQNATGMFELTQQSTKLNPFESIGVDTFWNFSLPKAANFFDFNSIADVLFTIEYTALENQLYRNTVIENLDTTFEAARPYSFKNQFADQWYDLNNTESTDDFGIVNFDTLLTDFPANLGNIIISGVTLFFAGNNSKGKPSIAKEEISLTFIPSDNSPIVKGKESISDGNLISTTSGNGAPSWAAAQSRPVSGNWQLRIPKTVLAKIRSEEISDMLFVIYYRGETAKWV
jgi:hypothetical protein